jgi:multidrug efflux system outer membrane protein
MSDAAPVNRGQMRLWPFLPLLLAYGCAVGPNYKRPALDVPANFRGAPAPPGTNSLADLPWWGIFKDPTLQDLIRVALTNNYDLAIAVARVDQAQALLEQNRAALFPQVGYEGALSRGRNAILGNPFFSRGITASTIVGTGTVSWDIDLWGRIRRLTESARAQYFASQEARRDVMLSVVSQVAQAYFQLLALDAQLKIAELSTNSFGESYTIFSQRLEGGVVSKLETSAAEASLDAAAATVPDFYRQIVLQENLVNVLTGRNPGPVPRNHTLLEEQMPPQVPAGLPSNLLERRPDVREAEQTLRSANAQVGVAVANFFPNLSLTGLLGQVSPELSSFTAGASTAWSALAEVSGPIFQGGRLVGAYRQAKAARAEARARYESTLLTAFQEVANNLTSIQRLAETRVQQEKAVRAYQVAVQVAIQRYLAGRASYYEVLQEQQLLFPSENTLVQTELNQLLAVVQLYQALGGGFGADTIPRP